MSREVGERMSPEMKELHDLRAFKAYVHERLDAAGVPADPEPEQNAAHGCRIEGRLNYVLARLDTQTVTLERMRGALEALEAAAVVEREPLRFVCPAAFEHPVRLGLHALSAPVSAGEALLRAARELGAEYERDEEWYGDETLAGKLLAAYRAELAERGGK